MRRFYATVGLLCLSWSSPVKGEPLEVLEQWIPADQVEVPDGRRVVLDRSAYETLLAEAASGVSVEPVLASADYVIERRGVVLRTELEIVSKADGWQLLSLPMAGGDLIVKAVPGRSNVLVYPGPDSVSVFVREKGRQDSIGARSTRRDLSR